MKTNIPIINAANRSTQMIAARCLGNLNRTFNNVKRGSNKTANKKAISTGVIISFPKQNITAKQIKLTSIRESLA